MTNLILNREGRSTPCLSSSIQWSRTGKFTSACVPLFNVLTTGSSNAKFQHELFIMDAMNLELSGNFNLITRKFSSFLPVGINKVQDTLKSEQDKSKRKFGSQHELELKEILSNPNRGQKMKYLDKFRETSQSWLYGSSVAHKLMMKELENGSFEAINKILSSQRVTQEFVNAYWDVAFRLIESLQRKCKKNPRLIRVYMHMAGVILHKFYTIDPSRLLCNRLIGEAPKTGHLRIHEVARTESFRTAAIKVLENINRIANANGVGCQGSQDTKPTVSSQQHNLSSKRGLHQFPKMIYKGLHSLCKKTTYTCKVHQKDCHFETFKFLLNLWAPENKKAFPSNI